MQTGEPYSRLVAMVPKQEWFAVRQAMVGKRVEGSFLPANLTLLGIEKAAVERWSGVLLGLRKACDEPYQPGPIDEGLPRLAELAALAAHVKFASGERHGGVTYLLDSLKMAARIRKSAPEPADRCQSLVMAAFARDLAAIPLPECDRVRASVDVWIAEPTLQRAERARYALLRLHMRVEAFRWKNLKIPTQIGEAAPAAEIGKGIRYDTTPTGYRLRDDELGELGGF